MNKYCGHKSLAEMVDNHIHEWRAALEDSRKLVMLNANLVDWEKSENCLKIDHELKALDDIQNAIAADLTNAS